MSPITNIGLHRVRHGSIMDGLDELMQGEKAAIFYSDPPWGQGNLKYWQTVNKRNTGATPQPVPPLHDFLRQIFKLAAAHSTGLVFIEYGCQWATQIVNIAAQEGLRHLATAGITYNSPALPMHMHAFTLTAAAPLPQGWQAAVTGKHGFHAARAAVEAAAQPGRIILDPCCGFGGTARLAIKHGMHFRGNELNSARLAKTIATLTA